MPHIHFSESFLKRSWETKFTATTVDEFKKLFCQHRVGSVKDNVFFRPCFNHLHDSGKMLGMEESTNRIAQAIKKKEKIMIFGDFDTDGITSTVILVDGIEKMEGEVSYRIPDRIKDSHGLKKHLIDEIATTGTTLLITCDCGINDAEEVDYAVKLGIDVIITDHHRPDPKKFPQNAIAVVNPLLSLCPYPEKNLSGAGIAFKLILFLYQKINEAPAPKTWIERYAEIATIGLIADCVPLSGEVRTIVSLGLQGLRNSKWPALKIFFEHHEIKTIESDTISFHLAPRLNASSRLGDVKHAIQLFLGDEKKTFSRLDYFEDINEKRKKLTTEYIQQAKTQIDTTQSTLVFFHPEWQVGILGLIASRFSETHQKPVIAASLNDGAVHGSARAPEGYDLTEIFAPVKDICSRFGGHKEAAGFSVSLENFEILRKKVQESCPKKTENAQLYFEGFIAPDWINLDFLAYQEKFSPFGKGNESPIYGLRNLKLIEQKIIGKDKNHFRAVFRSSDKKEITVLGFFKNDWLNHLRSHQNYDCLVQISQNVWQSNVSIQFKLVDLRISKT